MKMFNVLLLSVFVIASIGADALAEKPKPNSRTQTRTTYGCQRPREWGTFSLEIYHEGEMKKCRVDTRNLILYLHSKDTATTNKTLSIKKCKKIGDIDLCCKVTSGYWQMNRSLAIVDPSALEIDHILPFAYIKYNIKSCDEETLTKYYNFVDNLVPTSIEENRRKSNEVCNEQEVCALQKHICKKMAKEFDDPHFCDDLMEIANRQNFKKK